LEVNGQVFSIRAIQNQFLLNDKKQKQIKKALQKALNIISSNRADPEGLALLKHRRQR